MLQLPDQAQWGPSTYVVAGAEAADMKPEVPLEVAGDLGAKAVGGTTLGAEDFAHLFDTSPPALAADEAARIAAVEADKPTPIAGSTTLRPGYWKAATPDQAMRAASHGFADLPAGDAKYQSYTSASR